MCVCQPMLIMMNFIVFWSKTYVKDYIQKFWCVYFEIYFLCCHFRSVMMSQILILLRFLRNCGIWNTPIWSATIGSQSTQITSTSVYNTYQVWLHVIASFIFLFLLSYIFTINIWKRQKLSILFLKYVYFIAMFFSCHI